MLIIAGPTASGKTEFSLKLAGQLPLEIISADSRQIYRNMDIGTAKLTWEDLRNVPHHCIDICSPDQYFSAGEYAKLARELIADIDSRNCLPVVVGGSGLYIQALVDGFFDGNYRDPEFRTHLQARARELGWSYLYQELCRVDPDTAQMVHANDHKRIIRALEVYSLAGRPVSQIRKEETVPGDFQALWFALNWPRDVLYKRIDSRVEQMIESGLVNEVKQLLDQGYDHSLNSLNTVGYKEMIAHLNHEISFDTAICLIKKNTRRFAKRQLSWFRRNPRIEWLNMETKEDIDRHIETVMSRLDSHKEKQMRVS